MEKISENTLSRMKNIVQRFDEFLKTVSEEEHRQYGRFVVAHQSVFLLASSGKGLLPPKEWDEKDFQCAMEALPQLYYELAGEEKRHVTALRMAEVWREAVQIDTLMRR